jgi:hypothetical protein
MTKVKSSKTNYALPGREMDQKELEQMINEAQKGPFHSVQSLKEEISKWKAKHSK